MKRIGAFRHRVVLEAPSDLPDGAGGVTRTWVGVVSLSAAIRPVGERERPQFDALQSRVDYEVCVRSGADIAATHRFRFGDRILEIRAVHPADPQGTRLRCLCEEVAS